MLHSPSPTRRKRPFAFLGRAVFWRAVLVCLLLLLFPVAWLTGSFLRTAPAVGSASTVSANEDPHAEVSSGGSTFSSNMNSESSSVASSAQSVFTEQELAILEATCGRLPGTLSVYVRALDTGEEFIYNEDAAYYCASILKAPYALWLCKQADAGLIDLDSEIYFPPNRQKDTGPLAAYYGQDTIPARLALSAMLETSDNDGTCTLSTAWPGTEDFQTFLASLDFAYPETCFLADQTIRGTITVSDISNAFLALYEYFGADEPNSDMLKQTMSSATHNILYLPSDVVSPKKYGSWSAAFHDAAIVYAENPYLVVVLSDWGDAEISFPEEPVARMQLLGRLIAYFSQN